MKRAVGSYSEDNLKSARTAGDDTGLPESPIYSNFSKHLWRTHTRLGLARAPGVAESSSPITRGGKGEGDVSRRREE